VTSEDETTALATAVCAALLFLLCAVDLLAHAGIIGIAALFASHIDASVHSS